MNNYKIIKVLGDGSFGTVLKALDTKTNQNVAIKKMKSKFKSWRECLELREVKSLKKLIHVNVIKLDQVIRENDILYFVFEFIENGDLYSLLKGKLSELQVKKLAFQTCNGLSYIHSQGFFHRDCKPENILVTIINGELIVKIADFGLAKEIRSLPPYTEYVSTRWYRAPELLLHSRIYSSPVDMWAVGAIFAEMISVEPLLPGSSEMDQLYKTIALLGTPADRVEIGLGGGNWIEGLKLANSRGFSFPKLPPIHLKQRIPTASENAIHLISDLLLYDPGLRPSASNAMNYEYFDQVREEMNRKLSAMNVDFTKIVDQRRSTIASLSKEQPNSFPRTNEQSLFSNSDLILPTTKKFFKPDLQNTAKQRIKPIKIGEQAFPMSIERLENAQLPTLSHQSKSEISKTQERLNLPLRSPQKQQFDRVYRSPQKSSKERLKYSPNRSAGRSPIKSTEPIRLSPQKSLNANRRSTLSPQKRHWIETAVEPSTIFHMEANYGNPKQSILPAIQSNAGRNEGFFTKATSAKRRSPAKGWFGKGVRLPDIFNSK